jgi:hypothetical protein
MRLFIAIAISLLFVGCTGAINDFVDGGGGTDGGETPPIASLDGDDNGGFKLSPGSVIATSATISMRATLTPTRQQLKSATVNAELSLHSSNVR